METVKFNKEFFLVKFPIIFPLIYAFFLYQFPNFETQLIIITILLLAETHFGATWPFFLDKVNYKFIQENKINLVFIPILIIFLCLLGFFLITNIFYLIFFAANMYHVTRQSFGVSKLYCKNITENTVQTFMIYFFNIIFFVVGFFRFFVNIIDDNIFFELNMIILLILFISFIYYLIRFGFSENFLTFVTGCLIFYPICFVSNPVHAIIMGVTMHYTQYLYLTYNVCNARKSSFVEKKHSFLNNKFSNYFVIIIIYSAIMTFFSIFGKNETQLQYLIIIPIIGQMLHFYLDSQLWKFSQKHNRDNTLMHLNNLN